MTVSGPRSSGQSTWISSPRSRDASPWTDPLSTTTASAETPIRAGSAGSSPRTRWKRATVLASSPVVTELCSAASVSRQVVVGRPVDRAWAP